MKRFWQFRNAADDDAAELLFYGPISEYTWWGDEVTPKQFNDDLAALGDIKNLKLRINSPGGDVFAAAAIHNSLKNHPATVTAYIDGWAASAASVVAMAGDTIVMPKTAMMMIHNPSTIAWGDAREMRTTADILDKVRDTIIAAYEEKTGLDRTKLINLMNSETWMTADEAEELGFADEVDETASVSASVRGDLVIVNGLGFELDRFKTIPAAFAQGRKEVPNMATAGNASPRKPEAEGAAEEVMNQNPTVDNGTPTDATETAIKAERQRIADIQALTRPGAEEIIARAIETGQSPADTALEICTSDTVRNAGALEGRRSDAAAAQATPSEAPANGEPKQKRVGLLTNFLRKEKGLPPEG